jgi:hypothetical protein
MRRKKFALSGDQIHVLPLLRLFANEFGADLNRGHYYHPEVALWFSEQLSDRARILANRSFSS